MLPFQSPSKITSQRRARVPFPSTTKQHHFKQATNQKQNANKNKSKFRSFNSFPLSPSPVSDALISHFLEPLFCSPAHTPSDPVIRRVSRRFRFLPL